jgi:WD40 repeat protein
MWHTPCFFQEGPIWLAHHQYFRKMGLETTRGVIIEVWGNDCHLDCHSSLWNPNVRNFDLGQTTRVWRSGYGTFLRNALQLFYAPISVVVVLLRHWWNLRLFLPQRSLVSVKNNSRLWSDSFWVFLFLPCEPSFVFGSRACVRASEWASEEEKGRKERGILMRPILLKGHERPLTFLKYNRDGDLLFSCAKDHTPTVWYAHNGERLGTYRGHNGAVWCCDVSSMLKPSTSYSPSYFFFSVYPLCFFVLGFPMFQTLVDDLRKPQSCA